MSLADDQAKLTIYLNAETALLGSAQSYTLVVGGVSRQITRANLKDVQERITYYQRRVALWGGQSMGGARVNYLPEG